MKLIKILKAINEEEKFYGGSSNWFKCYRTASVGMGAGMQAFGWGLYFAKDINYEYLPACSGKCSEKKYAR